MSINWRESANCLGIDVDVFFTLDENNSAYPQLAKARQICADCPVRALCLKDAMEAGEVHYGVRGGLVPKERKALRDRVA